MSDKLLENYCDLVPQKFRIVNELYKFLIGKLPNYCDDISMSFGSGALHNWILIRYKNHLIGRVNGRRALDTQDRIEIYESMVEIIGGE